MPRRALIAGAAALPLAACGPNRSGSTADPTADLRVSWYGGQPVHDGVEGALAAFRAARPDLGIAEEKAPFADYWDKLATQIAGRQGPDVVRMSMTWLSEYSRRGALMDLSGLVGASGPIDLSGLDGDTAAAGSTDHGRVGIGQSSITQACFRNPALAAERGIRFPATWSWDDFGDLVRGFATEAGPGMYGTTDAGGDLQLFEVFARQRGTELFEGQSLAVGADVLEEWFALWQGLREDGAAPPPDVSMESGDFETNQLSVLHAALTFGWVQQVTFYQPLLPDHPLEITDVPGTTAGDLGGQFVTALDFWSVLATSQRADDSAELISFLLSDEAAVRSLGLSLGVPPARSSRDALAADPDSAAGKALAYVESVTGRTGPPPAPWPAGYGTLQGTDFSRIHQEVAFGAMTPTEAAGAVAEAAAAALGG
ncbi:ABC transporter substrate-binding protein [Brachybacterium hainanense]|uniref:ABC transporter substrate-binding protein n=1 Tax=Brachybacterium hainanense TaxID=1541174 RepID=A0ABV6RBN5_9MICO